MQQFSTFFLENWYLFLALVVILAMLARTFVGSGAVKGARPLEALNHINHQDALVLDVRTDKEYREGHILNSLHIPLGVLSGRLKELEPYRDSAIVVSCRSGARSAQAAAILRKQGFAQVYNLSGGVMAWQNANLPLTTEVGKPPKPMAKATAEAEPAPLEAPAAEPGEESPVAAAAPEVTIYTAPLCPYCSRAIKLLQDKGVAYSEKKLDQEPELRQEMEQRAKRDSVPQIFIGDQHVGGCDELYALDREGKLDAMLGLTSELKS